MSYRVDKKGDKFCVVDNDTGRVVQGACYKSRTMAIRRKDSLTSRKPKKKRPSRAVKGPLKEQRKKLSKSKPKGKIKYTYRKK